LCCDFLAKTYLYTRSLPEKATNVFHPILAIVLSAELGVYALSMATGKGFEATLGAFSTPSYIPMSEMIRTLCGSYTLIAP
jgi:hypothetical protein